VKQPHAIVDDPDVFPTARAPVRWLLLPLMLLAVGYYVLLLPTPVGNRPGPIALLTVSWIPVLLALAAAARSARRRAMLDTPPTRWKDGEAVAICGRVAGGAGPVISPLGEQPCAAYSWRLVTPRPKHQDVVFGRGTAVASAQLETPWGPVELQGVPTIEVDRAPDITADSARARLAQHLLGDRVERHLGERTVDAAAALRGEHPLVQARADADGRLAFAFVHPPYEGPLADADLWRRAEATARFGASSEAVRDFTAGLQSARYRVFESIIAVGAPVCAYGTWDATQRRLLIGAPVIPGRYHALIGRDAAGERRASRIGATVLVLLALLIPAAANLVVFKRVQELAAERGR